MKIAMKIAYLGDRYYGFQRQPGLLTVDSKIRDALAQIGVANGDFCYAGRTDRGVSAMGQVIDFSIEDGSLARPRCINGRLPRDIWAWAHAVAPAGFSARWSALWREYRYLLWHPGLDLERMREGADLLLGEHDFRNFSSCKEDTVRTILRLEIIEEGGTVVLDIRADGFLWSMVRRIARALEMIGSGEMAPGWIEELLDTRINRGAPAAPPEGLILMDVGYEGLDWQVDEYARRRAARALASTVQRRMAQAMVARELERSMIG